ncbi:hypothetical protein SKAU_G00327620 [Synaphobranchus kaupii]|uniref:Uncharacterized protein n=1 Tax=Synaphobranchus kaupii TaxID=118154 RepID=A0A9Q1EQ24_SYNKA|nr:hypothetical protein SKAU_G00327620 [Synaphobranchus kaupii]
MDPAQSPQQAEAPGYIHQAQQGTCPVRLSGVILYHRFEKGPVTTAGPSRYCTACSVSPACMASICSLLLFSSELLQLLRLLHWKTVQAMRLGSCNSLCSNLPSPSVVSLGSSSRANGSLSFAGTCLVISPPAPTDRLL